MFGIPAVCYGSTQQNPPAYVNKPQAVISGFRRKVNKNCALLGYYAAGSGNFLATFRDNLSVPPYSSLRNNPEERTSHLLHSGSLKSRNVILIFL
jgi:hypothetical protein